jgi:hypothetical protein
MYRMNPPIEFNVYPNIKQAVTICKATVTVQSYVMFKSATLCVSLLDANDSVVSVKLYTLEGEAFASWGTDDSYLVSWVKKQIQLETLVPVV